MVNGPTVPTNAFGDALQQAGVPMFTKSGTALTHEERSQIARRKCLCEHCGIPTHKWKSFRKQPLSNENVYQGICILDNPSLVPPSVYKEWKERNPSLARSSIGLSPPPRGSSVVGQSPTQGHSSSLRRQSPSQISNRGVGGGEGGMLNSSMTRKEGLQPNGGVPPPPPLTSVTENSKGPSSSDKPQNKKTIHTGDNEKSTNVPVRRSLMCQEEPVLKVFQACPLAYEDFMGRGVPIPFIDLESEETLLKETLQDTNLSVVFETATANTLGTFLSQGNPLLHLSCHGDPTYLFIEDGYGGGQQILVDENLKGWIQAGGQKLSFVFVSACHSRSAGEAFVQAGVSHVVCCEQDTQALSNTAAMVFARDFYRAVANGRTVQQAYDLAMYAVIHSSELSLAHNRATTPKMEAKKFALLPEGTDHNILLFSPASQNEDPSIAILRKKYPPPNNAYSLGGSRIPIPPQRFLGREVDMYRIIRTLFLKKARLVRITGAHPGMGKLSLAKALGHYMAKRTMWGPIFWLPSSPRQGNDHQTDIANQWSRLFALIQDNTVPATGFESNSAYVSLSQGLLDHFYEKKTVIMITATQLADHGIAKLNAFLDDVFERTKNAKVIVTHNPATIATPASAPISSRHATGFPCVEVEFPLAPLSFDATITLFKNVCPHAMSDPTWPMDHPLVKKRKRAWKVLGEGIPARIILIAKTMTQMQYKELRLLGENDQIQVSDFLASLSSLEEIEKLLSHSINNHIPKNSYRGVENHDQEEDSGEIVGGSSELQSAPPPLRSQVEMVKRFAPLLKKEGKVYRKSVTSYIRQAKEGEQVVTTIDGVEETKYKVENATSWVVCGKAAGEHYVLTEKEFQENYDTMNPKVIQPSSGAPRIKRLRQQGFMEYRSRRQVWARKVDEHDMNYLRHGNESTTGANEAYFMAPWGESMRIEQGDVLVMQYPGGCDEIYRVEFAVFEYSYALSNDSEEDLLREKWPAVNLAFVVGAVAALLGLLYSQSRGFKSR